MGLADWSYERVELTGEALPGWLAALDLGWRGVSVTMPAKRAALRAAHTGSVLAETLGAANTLVRTERGWHADNTDVAGLVGALAESGIRAAGVPDSVTILGAGGTAAAAVAAVAELGGSRVALMVRDPARARSVQELARLLGVSAALVGWPEAEALAADLVISTVPAAASVDLLGHRWRPGQVVVDVTYDPWPPALVEAARARGAHAIGGAAVLLWQAVEQVGLMTGHRAPVDGMRAALLPGGNLAPA